MSPKPQPEAKKGEAGRRGEGRSRKNISKRCPKSFPKPIIENHRLNLDSNFWVIPKSTQGFPIFIQLSALPIISSQYLRSGRISRHQPIRRSVPTPSPTPPPASSPSLEATRQPPSSLPRSSSSPTPATRLPSPSPSQGQGSGECVRYPLFLGFFLPCWLFFLLSSASDHGRQRMQLSS